MTQQELPAEQEELPAEDLSLWRHRQFLLLWSGQTVGELGARITSVIVPLIAVNTLNASAFQVSLLTSLTWLPFLFFSLPAGMLADRIDHRHLMITCDVGRALLMSSVPVVSMIWDLKLWYLYAVVSAAGVFTVQFSIAYQSRLPLVVKSHQLTDSTAKLEMSRDAAELVGPAIGGALVGLVGASRAFFANGLAYFVSAVTLWLNRAALSTPEPTEEAAKEHVPLRKEIGEGFAFIRGRPVLLSILACTMTSNFFTMACSGIGVTFLVRELGAASWTVGLIFSANAVVGLVTGLLASRIIKRVGTARVIWLAMALPGPFYLFMPAALPGWGVVTYACGLAAFSVNVVLFNVAGTSYRQRVTPSKLLGRVNASFLWGSYGVLPVGAFVGGLLASWLGLRGALLVGVLGMWSAALFVVFSPLRKIRDLDLSTSGSA